MDILSLDNLSFAYDVEAPVLRNLSLSIQAGESVGLVGANGVGKSTLLKLLVGLNLGYSGTASVAGIPIVEAKLAELRQQVGYMFQDADNQLFLQTVAEELSFGPMNYGFSKERIEDVIQSALQRTGCEALRNKQVYKLSGGEKRMVALATLLVLEPQLLLLDEPSAALDPRNRRRLINVLNELPVAKLIASHDLDLILDTCSRTVLLSQGRIVADGPTSELLQNQQLLEEHGLELPLSLQARK